MLTLTFSGDESGDTSFSFRKGASRNFVYALIATENPDTLRLALDSVRKESRLTESYEFKFHSLTSVRLRQQVFAKLSAADFEAWAIVVDKTILPDPYKVMGSLELYLFFVSELIQKIPVEKRQDARLILDEYGSAKSLVVGLRRVLKLRDIPKGFKQIVSRRSSSEPLIQIADLVAGAVLRRDSTREAEYYDTIAGKMHQVYDFQP